MNQQGKIPVLAPVEVDAADQEAVAHSLAILSSVYHYNHWIFDLVREHLGPRVVEVGSGVGNITQFLLNQLEVVCLEPFASYRDYLASRFASHANVTVHPLAIEQVPCASVPAGEFDSVICLNVLEHIADDLDALARMRQLLRPGGKAIIFVPALQWLYGAMDRAMGHERRYSRRRLCGLMKQAGLQPRHSGYVNMVGAAAWWWRGRILRRDRIPESATRLFDRMVPMLSALERIVRPPLGQSVFCVGEAV